MPYWPNGLLKSILVFIDRNNRLEQLSDNNESPVLSCSNFKCKSHLGRYYS